MTGRQTGRTQWSARLQNQEAYMEASNASGPHTVGHDAEVVSAADAQRQCDDLRALVLEAIPFALALAFANRGTWTETQCDAWTKRAWKVTK